MPTVTYTLPIYEAVVCNLTVEKIRQQEDQEKLLSLVLESVSLCKRIVRFFIKTDFSVTSAEVIEQTFVGLGILTDSGRRAVSAVRNDLPTIGEKYRSTLATAIDDLEATVDGLEEISEAWAIPYTDESTVLQIKQALSVLTNKKNEKEIPDWRDALAALSD